MSSFFGRNATHFDTTQKVQDVYNNKRNAFIGTMSAATNKFAADLVTNTAETSRVRTLTIPYRGDDDTTVSISNFLTTIPGYDNIFSMDVLDSTEFNTIIDALVAQLKKQGYAPTTVEDQEIIIIWPAVVVTPPAQDVDEKSVVIDN
jgi:hypothetical protein